MGRWEEIRNECKCSVTKSAWKKLLYSVRFKWEDSKEVGFGDVDWGPVVVFCEHRNHFLDSMKARNVLLNCLIVNCSGKFLYHEFSLPSVCGFPKWHLSLNLSK